MHSQPSQQLTSNADLAPEQLLSFFPGRLENISPDQITQFTTPCTVQIHNNVLRPYGTPNSQYALRHRRINDAKYCTLL